MTRLLVEPSPYAERPALRVTTTIHYPQRGELVLLTLPFPPGSNHYKRHVCKKDRNHTVYAYLTAEAKAYIAAVEQAVKAAGYPHLDGPVAITMHIYRPSRRWDCDGTYKMVFDCLQREKVIVNDNRIIEQHTFVHTVPKGQERVEVTIEPRGEW